MLRRFSTLPPLRSHPSPKNYVRTFIDNTACIKLISRPESVANTTLTIEALTPIADNIKLVLNNSIAQVQKLNGQPAAIILAPFFPGEPLVTLAELAAIVSQLLHVSTRVAAHYVV